jgi:hypothetical protein
MYNEVFRALVPSVNILRYVKRPGFSECNSSDSRVCMNLDGIQFETIEGWCAERIHVVRR